MRPIFRPRGLRYLEPGEEKIPAYEDIINFLESDDAPPEDYPAPSIQKGIKGVLS